MKKLLSIFLAILMIVSVAITSVSTVDAATRVKGYTTKKGTYVAPHYRSNSNSSKFDNYSTKGNVNPYNGKKGTVNPYKKTVKKYKY